MNLSAGEYDIVGVVDIRCLLSPSHTATSRHEIRRPSHTTSSDRPKQDVAKRTIGRLRNCKFVSSCPVPSDGIGRRKIGFVCAALNEWDSCDFLLLF